MSATRASKARPEVVSEASANPKPICCTYCNRLLQPGRPSLRAEVTQGDFTLRSLPMHPTCFGPWMVDVFKPRYQNHLHPKV